MANIIGGLSPVSGYKGNGHKKYKQIPAILKPKRLVRIKSKKVKEEGVV